LDYLYEPLSPEGEAEIREQIRGLLERKRQTRQ
jgi:hypothetical protein